MRGKIRSVGLTDVGRVREHNEDTIGVDADIGLFVLADGMGGYNAGEVASGIAVKTVMSLVKEAVEHQDMSSARSGNRHGAPEHRAARRDRARQQDHLPDRQDPAAMRRHGHDDRRLPVLRQQGRRSPTSATRALYRLRANRFEQMTHGPLAAAGARRPGLLFPGRGPAGRRTRTTSPGRSASSRPWRSRSTSSRSRRAISYVLCSDGLSGHGRRRRHSLNYQHL